MVAGLAENVREQDAQRGVGVRVPDPSAFAVEVEQHLRDRQGEQFGVGEPRCSSASGVGRHDVVVEQDVEFGQEGFEFFRHTLILKPSAYSSTAVPPICLRQLFKESGI